MPPDEYRSWWEATEACSSTSGDFDLVQWYHASSIIRQGENVSGLWEPPHDITIRRDQEMTAFVVRHEMLHELLRGNVDHELPAWLHCDLFSSSPS